MKQSIGNITNASFYGGNVNGINNKITSTQGDIKKIPPVWPFVILLIINAALLATSIIVLCHVLPRGESLQFDYMGVLVGVLTLLVTVLIGWNVYTLIDVKNQSKQWDDKSMELNKLIGTVQYVQNNSNMLAEYTAFNVYEYLILREIRPNLEYHLLYHGLNVIRYAMLNDDKTTADTTAKVLLEMLVSPSVITLPQQYKNALLSSLSNVNHSDMINGFNDLLDKIAHITVSA